MSLLPSSRETRSVIPLGVRLARVGVVGALLCLGVYAAVVAWDRFRPRQASATVAASRRPVRKSTADTAKARPTLTPTPKSPAKPAVEGPAPASDAQLEDPEVNALSTPEKGGETFPDEGETNTAQGAPVVEPTTPAAEGQSVSMIATVAAELWDRSKQLVQERIEQTVQTLEEQAAEAAKQRELLAQQQSTGTPAVEPAPLPVNDSIPEVKTARSTGVLLSNPAESGGIIHYLVDGAAYSLHPGQMHELDGERAPRVEFHRGGQFGDAVYNLGPGKYVVHVTQGGWNLDDEPSPSAR